VRSRTDDLVERYLDRLDAAMRGAPSETRNELLDDIREHIDAARAEARGDPEVDVREILDRLGPPEQIAREAWPAAASPAPTAGPLEWAAVIFLLVGGVIFPLLGWLVGVVLLWCSKVWTPRAKAIGTLVIPGGLLLATFLMLAIPLSTSTTSCGPLDTGSVQTTIPVGTPSAETPQASEAGGCQSGDDDPNWFAFGAFALAVVLPIGTSVYLVRQARRPAPRAAR
jgi:hypothetical protein